MQAGKSWIVAVGMLASGCVTPTFTTGYRPGPQLVPSRQRGTLAVQQFTEARPPREYSTQGKMFMTYIPLLPWVSLPFERFDEDVALMSDEIKSAGARRPIAPPLREFEYPVSIPRAIAEDLAASGLFQDVRYVGGGPTTDYRFVLSGAVQASPLVETATSYGLGFAGVLLWPLALPMQKQTAAVTVALTLTDTTSGAVIWTDTLHSEVSRIATMYSTTLDYGNGGIFTFSMLPLPSDAPGVDRNSLFSWHFAALRQAMEVDKPKLAAALAGGQ